MFAIERKIFFHRPSTTQRRNSRTSLSPLFPDTIPAKLWSTTTTRVDFCAREDARNTNQILLISRARIQNRSREGFLKFKRVRSPSARDREWVGVHRRRRQKVGRASSSSPEWCWLLRAKKREREKTSLLKSARSQKGDDGLKSPEFSEETKKKLERSRRKMYKKKQTKK